MSASAVAIGNFDGVHVGHRALVSEAAHWARQHNLRCTALTFDPHPAAIVAPHRVPALICTLEKRLELLRGTGAEDVIVLPFTAEVARLTPEAFVSEIVVNRLKAKAVFVGENFRFGHKQAGTPETLQILAQQYGFEPHFLPPVQIRGEVVSSSAIRRYLAERKIARAGRLLGRCFSIEGRVVPGRGIGKKETVPTLNLTPAPGQIVPHGIFVSETLERSTGCRWPSVTSAGTNPTFDGSAVTIETYLLEPLIGSSPEYIEVQFRHFIRAEQKFPTVEALRAEIFRDVERARNYWRRISRFAALLNRTTARP